jgi:hypothetical protein
MFIENGLFYLPNCTNIQIFKTFDDGCRFLETLKYLVSKADSSLTVDINPANANFVVHYLQRFTYLRNILIYDKSDIKNPNSGDPAPFEMITIKKYMEILKAMFQLDWYIDEVGGVKYFKLRHPSENLTSTVWINLCNYKGENLSRNIGEYQANSTIAVRKYGLEFEKSSNPDFDYGYQEYDTFEEAINTVQLSDTVTNIGYLYSLPESFSDFGLCIVACDSSNNVLQTPHGIINDKDFVNAPLCASRLVYDHWNYSAAYPICKVNGVLEQVVNTAIGTYKTAKYDLPLTDFDDINVNGLVITDLSETLGVNMYVNTITQKFDNDFAEIILDF